jgi:hypothetical protein
MSSGVIFVLLHFEIIKPATPQDLIDPPKPLELPASRHKSVRAFDKISADF